MKIRTNARVTSFFASLLIRLLGVTWRLEIKAGEHLERAREMSGGTISDTEKPGSDKPGRVIFAFFHGRLLALSWSHRNRNVHVLASEHYDGDLMGKTIEWLGFGHLKGSTTRGGARAIRELKGVLADGYDIGLTVDGPKGPRGKVQQGATELSRLTSCAVVPLTNTAKGRKVFGSWDRFQVPAPFAKVIVEYGEPLIVPGGTGAEERESLRIELEKRLGELTSRLDKDIGYTGEDVWPHEDS
jgi:lysophospholipid acyltransferase (LPLAT)-like uncharacterized protein